jgi:hypothetical protein
MGYNFFHPRAADGVQVKKIVELLTPAVCGDT